MRCGVAQRGAEALAGSPTGSPAAGTPLWNSCLIPPAGSRYARSQGSIVHLAGPGVSSFVHQNKGGPLRHRGAQSWRKLIISPPNGEEGRGGTRVRGGRLPSLEREHGRTWRAGFLLALRFYRKWCAVVREHMQRSLPPAPHTPPCLLRQCPCAQPCGGGVCGPPAPVKRSHSRGDSA